jgi:hypothetical protein
MNYFVMTFAVKADCLCRFGFGLAFVQHHKDRALAQSHFSVLPNAAKVSPFELLTYGFDSMTCITSPNASPWQAPQPGGF